VEGVGGFARQYEQIGRDRSVMFDQAEKLKFTATSEDRLALDALAHARRHKGSRGEFITVLGESGKPVDISFATRNWQRAVVDRSRPGHLAPHHAPRSTG
jgi:hypothetical protein